MLGYQHHPVPELKFSHRNNGLYLYLVHSLQMTNNKTFSIRHFNSSSPPGRILYSFILSTYQVLGLWAVVVDHQLDLVISSLSNDNKNLLRQLAFRDMVVTPAGRDIATTLVHCLVSR